MVAQLKEVKPFNASGEINCPLLPGAYTLSWRIRLDKPLWWDSAPVHFRLSKDDVQVDERKCVLSKSYIRVEQFKVPKIRVVENGWREYDVGEFVVESGARMCHLKFAMECQDFKTGISMDGVVVQPRRTARVESVSTETLPFAGEPSRALEWTDNPVDRQKMEDWSTSHSTSATENVEKLEPQSSQGKRGISQESHVTSCLCDPFYPYFHFLPYQSTTAPRDCSPRPAEIPVWRALVDSEVGVESRLRKSLEPSTVERLLGQYGEGVRAQEQRNWKVAEYNFSELRLEIVCSVGQLEKQDYNFLLAWVDLPLAQLFQFQGGADMLNSVMNIRKEVLECVMPLQGSHESLVRVCKTYFYTAQYEWGAAVMSTQTKDEAILGYATLMACNEGEAEAQLCFLLCLDHEYSGTSKESLRWIQEANQVLKNKSPDEGSSCRDHFLLYESKLLMNLGYYQEAVKLLEDSIHIIQDPELALKVDKVLEECRSEIEKRTTVIDDSQLAAYNEKPAESQGCLQRSPDGL